MIGELSRLIEAFRLARGARHLQAIFEAWIELPDRVQAAHVQLSELSTRAHNVLSALERYIVRERIVSVLVIGQTEHGPRFMSWSGRVADGGVERVYMRSWLELRDVWIVGLNGALLRGARSGQNSIELAQSCGPIASVPTLSIGQDLVLEVVTDCEAKR